jgi:hypothetical protein
LVEGRPPDEVRRNSRAQVDSGQRTWKIKGTPDRHGAHPHPVAWTMTTADVAASGIKSYCANVERWAWSIY